MAETVERANVVRLKVAGARAEDVGKGTVRLGDSALERLGLDEGDVVELHGKRSTAAIALPAYPEDVGLEIVRMDGFQRANSGLGMGDDIEVRVGDVKAARRIQLAPSQKNLMLRGSGDALKRTLFGRPVVAGDVVSTSVYRQQNAGRMPGGSGDGRFADEFFREYFNQPAYALGEIRLLVTSTTPRGIVRVTADTEIELLPQYVEPQDHRKADVTYDDIGGLGPVLDQIREMIELPLKHPELFQRLGIDPPKGVLLHGPPGTGKTMIAKAVANESEARFFEIAGPEIMGKHFGESEERLRTMFQQAQREAPAIIFIDEIDSIAPKREEATSEVERRIVAQLLTLMDGIAPRQNVVVIGATNRPNALDEALRRPGRFDREIIIGVPDHPGRREVLSIHTRGMPLDDDVNLDDIARSAYGFVGADLSSLCREAAIDALRRMLPEINLSDREIPNEVLEKLRVTRADFESAQRRVQPSALREIMIQVPDVGWDDIGGLEDAKRSLRESVELPLRNPEAFRRLGIRPAKGFLLYGPPGTGKTLLAKAVARESEANFLATKSSDLLSKWYGESEQQVSRLFQRARQVAPAVIFIDEIDSLAPQRGGGLGEPAVTERVVNTILAEMDGLGGLANVVVIGATNRPTLLDPALLRPGRFDELIYVPVPDVEGRLKVLQIQSKGMPLAGDVDLRAIADRTQGYTGADLNDVVRRAGLEVIRENLEATEVRMRHFEAALTETRASVTDDVQREYEELRRTLKQESPRRPFGFTPPVRRAS